MKISNIHEVKQVIKAAFPEYKGRNISLYAFQPQDVRSFQDGLRKTTYKFVSLETLKVHEVEEIYQQFNSKRSSVVSFLPKNIVLVAHYIFRGKEVGVSISANPGALSSFLPPVDPLLSDFSFQVYG